MTALLKRVIRLGVEPAAMVLAWRESGDWTPLLALADWLEEHDFPTEARAIRLAYQTERG